MSSRYRFGRVDADFAIGSWWIYAVTKPGTARSAAITLRKAKRAGVLFAGELLDWISLFVLIILLAKIM